MSDKSPDTLVLVAGSAAPIVLEIFDERDQDEDLSTLTMEAFAIRTEHGDDGVDIIRKLTAAMSVSGNVVTITLDAADAAALREGRFVAGLEVSDGASNPYFTNPIPVTIYPPTA